MITTAANNTNTASRPRGNSGGGGSATTILSTPPRSWFDEEQQADSMGASCSSCGATATAAAALAVTATYEDYGTTVPNPPGKSAAASTEEDDDLLPIEAYPSSSDDDDDDEEEEDFDDDESENLRVLKSSWEGDPPMMVPPLPSLSVPASSSNFISNGRASSTASTLFSGAMASNAATSNSNNSHFSSINLPSNVDPAAAAGSACLSSNNNNTSSCTTTATTNPATNSTSTTAALGAVAVPRPAPSWQDLSQHVLPTAARELFTASVRRAWYTARWSYAASQWHRRYSDYGSPSVGYYNNNNDKSLVLGNESATEQQQQRQPPSLPAFSSLPWVERQMVREWRTYLPNEGGKNGHHHHHHLESNQQRQHQQLDTTSVDELMIVADDADENDNGSVDDDSNEYVVEEEDDDFDEHEFDRARTLVPVPRPRPVWRHADNCQHCRKPFGPTLLRHHCRLCGGSFCQTHSSHTHPLPHIQDYSMGVPERVCDACKAALLEQNWAERVAWRRARCRDYLEGDALQPYFDVGLDRVEDAAWRITHAALAMAKSLPLGAQATVAVETVDVLRKYGLSGIYTLVLRQEFLAAADLLLKALGINRTAWPLSVHELSAAIFYALAQHRALRGLNPEREHDLHAVRDAATNNNDDDDKNLETAAGESDDQKEGSDLDTPESNSRAAVCDPVPDEELQALIFFAPIALNFIYVEKEVDMQLLAAQQGWRLVYAYLRPAQQDGGIPIGGEIHDRPASALFVHQEQKIACVAVRGTSTIHDVITDIRQVPVPFPDPESVSSSSKSNKNGNASGTTAGGGDDEWTTVFRGQGLAVAGMAAAAVNLYREHVDSLLLLAKEGYQLRLVGHSLGGSVATLLGVLIYKDLVEIAERDAVGVPSSVTTPQKVPLHVYSFGTPSCVDLPLSEAVESFVTTVTLHDDVVPRLTPTSCRGLLKHLLHIRETWVKQHFANDIRAFTDRAKLAWAPRWRGGFTLSSTSSSIKLKRYCRKQLQYGKEQLLYGKEQLMSVKDKLVGDDNNTGFTPSGRVIDQEEDFPGKLDWRQGASSTTEAAQKAGDTLPPSAAEAEEPKLIMDFMGGIDVRTEGIVIDGDEFFDPGPDLLDSSENDDDSATTRDILDSSLAGSPGNAETNEEVLLDDVKISTSFDVVDGSLNADSTEKTIEIDDDNTPIEKTVEIDDDDAPGAVVLEETPLPRMFIPGKIVHIYSHRGVYRAAYVPRSFRELRRISLAGNMLSDHKTKSYFDALLEVRSVRDAKEDPPQWTAFDEDDTCSCCASRFTWASTSDNEAQEARDKHNCRSCGSLVCEPCSENRIPIPSIGLITAARVCDRCYHDIDGLMMGKASSKVTAADVIPFRADANDDMDLSSNKPTRLREKRSVVVDELAGKVQASALTCS